MSKLEKVCYELGDVDEQITPTELKVLPNLFLLLAVNGERSM